MNIATQTEIVLRDAGYKTWLRPGNHAPIVWFENPALIGFVNVLETVESLLSQWQGIQNALLMQEAVALRNAGGKAWNIYSIFLTSEQDSSQQWNMERIEEDFALTRKIACGGIRTPADVERVLRPLIAVKAKPLLEHADFEARLKSRLKEMPSDGVTAFLRVTSTKDIARLLGTER